VFDNGSPLGFIGYSDLVIGTATFLILCRWLSLRLAAGAPQSRSELVLPALFGIAWSWCAPQNVVIAPLACSAAAIVWVRRHGMPELRRPLAQAVLVFLVAAGIGATQFGSFLPHALREETGL